MAGRPLSYLATLSVDEVKGIGPAAAKKLGQAGIHTVADLLLHVPRRYLDRSQLFSLDSVPLGEEVTVAGTVQAVHQRDVYRTGKRKLKITEATVGDGTSLLKAVWFNPYLKLKEGAEVALSGKVERFRGRLQMKSPDIDSLEGDSLITGRVVPIHPAVGGLTVTGLRKSIANALARSRPIHDPIPSDVLTRLDLVDRDTAIGNIHFPDSAETAGAARARLVFDEWKEDLRQEARWLGFHTLTGLEQELAQAWRTTHSTIRLTMFDADAQLLGDSQPEMPLPGEQPA